jgi:hypothetical protein
MLECPSCGSAVHESLTRCLRCGKPISEATAKELPKQRTKYREGIGFGIISAILVLGLIAGIGYGSYRAYLWWTFRKNSEKVAKLSVGRHPGSAYPLLKLDLSFKLRQGQAYLVGSVTNQGKRFIGDVTYRYSCNEPPAGNSFSLGPFGPGEKRRFEQFLFQAQRLETCDSHVDFVSITQ